MLTATDFWWGLCASCGKGLVYGSIEWELGIAYHVECLRRELMEKCARILGMRARSMSDGH